MYNDLLPISEHRSEIIESIRNNQVTIVAGETGSGKTTQLPLMCLEAGRGSTGRIGCTQLIELYAAAKFSCAQPKARDVVSGELVEAELKKLMDMLSEADLPGCREQTLSSGMHSG